MSTMAEATNTGSSISPILPFGDINLVVLTDVHSWVAGHGHSEGPDLDVTYGDVVSFFERLKEYCGHDGGNGSDNGCGDLWLVQNGDWIDGTGLATDGDPSALIPLLERIPFDILNTGNHELYQDSVINEMRKPGGFLQWWGHRHLASNIYMNGASGGKNSPSSLLGERLEPMSNRYHVLKGKRSTVLVFGFIYNLPNPSDLVVVQTVEKAVEEPWFHDALTTVDYDAILVMLHAGLDDPSVEILRQKIREATKKSGIDTYGNLPIQFIAGHTHLRRYGVADPQSTVVEAGRYMDTVGWVSFPNAETIRNEKEKSRHTRNLETANFTSSNESMHPSTVSGNETSETNADPITDLFHHIFLDANVATLREALGLPASTSSNHVDDDDDFQTPLGMEVSAFIQQTRQSLGLTQAIGCAPRDYLLNRSMAHEDSLWNLYRDWVGPHAVATAALVDATALASSATTAITATENTTMASVAANHRVLFMSQDSWRYGLYGGNQLTYDDIIAVSPFNEPIYLVSVLPCSTILQLNQSMNDNATDDFLNTIPSWILSKNEEGVELPNQTSLNGSSFDADCELYVNHFGLTRVQNGLQSIHTEDTVWNPLETNLTTTSIWFSYVADKWQCGRHGGKHSGDGNPSINDTSKNWWGSTSNDSGGKNSGIVPGNVDMELMLKIALPLAVLCLVVACSCVLTRIRNTSVNNDYDGAMPLNRSCHSDDDEDAPDALRDSEFCDEHGEDIDSNERFHKRDSAGEPPVQIV